MKKVMVVVAVLGMAFQSHGAMLGEGTREFHVAGRCDSAEEINISLSCGMGYFLLKGVEVGVEGAFVYSGIDEKYAGNEEADMTQFGVCGFGEYNYDSGTMMIPYAGVTAGFKYWDYVGDLGLSLECSVYSGGKCYLMENFSVGTQFQIWMATDDIYVGNDDDTDTGVAERISTDWAVILSTRYYF